MNIDIDQLKDSLILIKEQTIASLDRVSKNKVKLVLEAQVRVLDVVLTWIHHTKKGEVTDMEKLQYALSTEMISLDDLPTRKRRSEVEEGILELVKELKPGKAIPVDQSKITYGNFYGRVTKMKKAGKLPDNIVVKKSGEGFLVGLTKSK